MAQRGGAAATDGVRALYIRGEKALQANDLNAAEKAFQEVLQRVPDDPGANANLGVIYMRRQQWGLALTHLKEAERKAPNLAGIRLNIGLVYYRQAKYDAAIDPFASVLRREPKMLQARYLLGLCYFFTGDYTRAVSTLSPIWDQESYNLNYL
ncbi:MAG TPA: tetratricopeptide repeat protein, partial [Terriglobales bacterium]|nr:tetratricopeptide repeat protein [Terriglobales bacterium]